MGDERLRSRLINIQTSQVTGDAIFVAIETAERTFDILTDEFIVNF